MFIVYKSSGGADAERLIRLSTTLKKVPTLLLFTGVMLTLELRFPLPSFCLSALVSGLLPLFPSCMGLQERRGEVITAGPEGCSVSESDCVRFCERLPLNETH